MQKKLYTWAFVTAMTLMAAGAFAINYSEMGFNSLKAIGPSDTQIDLWDVVNGGIKVACQNSTCGGGGGGGAMTVADGADVTQGANGDAANTTGTTGTISGKLRGMVQHLASLVTGQGLQATAAHQVTAQTSLTSIDGKLSRSGTSVYAIKKENLTTASSNLAFGFTSKKIAIRTSAANTDEVCIDYSGGTAACPAANTAGNARIPAGFFIVLDDMALTSISAIAASGTQTLSISAWN